MFFGSTGICMVGGVKIYNLQLSDRERELKSLFYIEIHSK